MTYIIIYMYTILLSITDIYLNNKTIFIIIIYLFFNIIIMQIIILFLRNCSIHTYLCTTFTVYNFIFLYVNYFVLLGEAF